MLRRIVCSLLVLAAAAAVLAAPAEARRFDVEIPDGGTQIRGVGTVRYSAVDAASAYSGVVRPGTIRFDAAGGPRLLLNCAFRRAPRSACARRLPGARAGVRMWRVIRPVKFFYEGASFDLTISTPYGFDLGISGSGTVTLHGQGQFVDDGAVSRYRSALRLLLR